MAENLDRDRADRAASWFADGPLPEEPEWMRRERTDAEWEADWLLYQASLVDEPAPDRYERDYGVSWISPDGSPTTDSLEEMAAVAQEVAVQLARVSTIADARRIGAVLAAYEHSITDLAARFGRSIGDRAGLGAQAFFTSMGLLLRMHPRRVAHEVDAARTLRDRLPLTWALFQSGGASWSRVDLVAAVADGLDPDKWAAYDEVAVKKAASSTRLKHDLRVARERLQADTAATRARRTHERRTTSLELGHDGEASLVITGPAAALVACNDAIQRAAVAAHGANGETRSLAQLRHDIALDLLDEGLRRGPDPEWPGGRVPGRKRVGVTLILTVPVLSWLGRTVEPAQLEGCGPIAMEVAKDLAGDATSMMRVLTDPHTGVRLSMDRKVYAPPSDLARWVRIRDGRSRFPGSTRSAWLSDIDHAREWQHDGRTEDKNLVTLDRPAHNLKSAGLFEEDLKDTGACGWTDAWRHYFEDPPQDLLDPAPPHLLPARNDTDDEPPF